MSQGTPPYAGGSWAKVLNNAPHGVENTAIKTICIKNKGKERKLPSCLLILTYNVKELGHGLGGHEFVLEGPEDALQSLVNWHVVVPDVFCQREGPAPLCVARGNFLRGPNRRKVRGLRTCT